MDALYSRFDLSRRVDYQKFLSAQAAAQIPVELALERAGARMVVPDWDERRRADFLRSDLSLVGITNAAILEPPEFNGFGEVLGAVYVIEGARKGGAVLKRSLPAGLPVRFLGAPSAPGAWQRLVTLIDEALSDQHHLDAAIGAARAVFGLFEKAGRVQA